MRYLTHQFAHSESLDRAHRWLISAGVSSDRMHVHRHGVPRLTVALEPAEIDGIELVIHAAENLDPDGLPSFWELARVEPNEHSTGQACVAALTSRGQVDTFQLEWHQVDETSDEETRRQIELQRDYRQTRP